MRSLKQITLFILTVVIFATCKKEQLQPNTTVNQPVFSFEGSINNYTINWQAGVNNYYMNSTYNQDVNNVYNFMGTLQPTTTSKNSIQFIINDDTVSSNNGASDINKSVTPATIYVYHIPGGNSIQCEDTFTPIVYAGIPSSYTYSFGDNSKLTTTLPGPVIHTYKKMANYTTSLNVDFNSCGNVSESNPVNLVKLVNPLVINSISSNVIYDSLSHDSVGFTATVEGGSLPYTYTWNFGDLRSKTVYSAKVYHSYIPQHNNTFPCKLTVTDAALNSAIYNYTVSDSTDTAICRMDYRISSPKPLPNPFALSNITINYTDGNGTLYTSNNSSQSSISAFQVVSVASYQNNLNNQSTKMLKVTFNCLLYPAIGLPIPASGTATIAVAYK